MPVSECAGYHKVTELAAGHVGISGTHVQHVGQPVMSPERLGVSQVAMVSVGAHVLMACLLASSSVWPAVKNRWNSTLRRKYESGQLNNR